MSDAVTQLAERYYDGNIAPLLRSGGCPEYAIEQLRKKYIGDIHNNQIAIEELKEHYQGDHA